MNRRIIRIEFLFQLLGVGDVCVLMINMFEWEARFLTFDVLWYTDGKSEERQYPLRQTEQFLHSEHIIANPADIANAEAHRFGGHDSILLSERGINDRNK